MSTGEQSKGETRRESADGKARGHGGQPSDDGREVPLFLKDGSDGHKGDAQDEKDEVGE